MHQEKTSDDWADGSHGFAQLSPAHRAKSMSSPALTSPQKQMRGASDQRKRKSQTVSKAEQERQQILEEMKKRTQLLTDNSWIRQRSASFYKDPIVHGLPIKSRSDDLYLPPTSVSSCRLLWIQQDFLLTPQHWLYASTKKQCMGCRQDLRGAETGVKVRIHNKRAYCETCYIHIKSAGTALL
ncbi:hypothetical protein WMY93_013475 [Mugilogobius chulae]|uniref:LIM zinc-binding domain-containing protein n=1 Tax=Mugilogobius chulae TaxID=88201 RepID=A0AAW0P3J6_9GOBI